MGRRRFLLLAVCCVLLSLGLNLYGIDYGVPGDPSWMPHPLKMGNYLEQGALDSDYGPLPQVIAGHVCRVGERLLGADRPGHWNWIVAQRLFNSLLGALSVALLIAIAALTHGRAVALFAGLLGACAEGLIFWSKTESVNSQAVFWTMALLLAAALIGRYRHPLLWLLAGVCAGLLLGTKETFFGYAAALPLLAAGFYVGREQRRWSTATWLLLGVLLYGLAAAGLYLLAGATDWQHFMLRLARYTSPDLNTTMPGRTLYQSTVLEYYTSQVTNVLILGGQVLFPGALLLVLVGLVGRRRPGWGLRLLPLAVALVGSLLLMFAVPWTIGVKRVIESYDLIPLGLALAVPAGAGLLRIQRTTRITRPLRLAVVILVCCYILLVGLSVDCNLMHNARYKLAAIGDVDPGPHRVYFEFSPEHGAPLLPPGWTVQDSPQGADLLIDLADEQQLLLDRGWQVKWRVDPPWTSSLTWFEYSFDSGYVVLQCPGECR
ncbi:MAG: hypothetical protein P9M14_12340 [Candidatus Alcyoniella australis]|nr:hypothetical protein [Candidatus Alcyoniella australis]